MISGSDQCSPKGADRLKHCSLVPNLFLLGKWVYYSYGNAGFNWFNPKLFETLFSSNSGLFIWSPIILLAIAGLIFRATYPLIMFWCLGGVLLWYANSSWFCWYFGDAFGARSFIELSGLFGIGLGLCFSKLRGKIVIPIFAATILFNVTFMTLYTTHLIPRDGYLFRPNLEENNIC